MDPDLIKSEPVEVAYEEEYHTETKCGKILRRANRSYIFICELCQDTFDSMVSFGVHLESKHFSISENIKLELDGIGGHNQPFETSLEMIKPTFSEAHNAGVQMQVDGQPSTEQHDGSTNWSKGDYCEETQPTIDSNSALSANNYKIVCEFCNAAFMLARVFRAHVVMEHGNSIPKILEDDPKYLTCARCNQTFEKPLERHKHEKTHKPSDPYRCPECPKLFSSLPRRESHMSAHKDSRPFACEICGKRFKWKHIMVKHRNIHQGKTYKCEHCDELFRTKSNLDQHMHKHSGVRYECKHCNKEFVAMRLLKIHLESHNDERPYECTICKARMKRFDSLQKHMRNHELRKDEEDEDVEWKPFKCEVCGKRCTTIFNLNRHRIRHTDERKYECVQCKVKFKHVDSLKKHIKNHEKKKKKAAETETVYESES